MADDKKALMAVEPEDMGEEQVASSTNKKQSMDEIRKQASQGSVAIGGRPSRAGTTAGNGVLLNTEAKRSIVRDLYCIVLPTAKVRGGPHKTVEEIDEYRQTLVNDLSAAGLRATLFYSCQEDEVYVKVGADDARLLAEADHTEYVLELDPEAMKTIAESKLALPERGPIHLEPPFDHEQKIMHQSVTGAWVDMADGEVATYLKRFTHLGPFEQLHARYNDEWEVYGKETFGVQVYKLQKSGTILRMADRMKLIQIIMERSRAADLSTGFRGGGLNLQEMVMKKMAMGVFPLQNALNSAETGEKTVDELFSEWNQFCKLPWNQPIEDIRDYFGEKIALYFAFLGHYTKWLASAAIIGLAVFIHQLYEIWTATGAPNFFDVTRVVNESGSGNNTVWVVQVYSEVPEAGVFAIFISLWASFMIESWKRKQARHALKWGTSNFEATEVVRPEFTPTHFLPSPVTGKSEPYYSQRSFLLKIFTSIVFVVLCIGVVISAIVGIFVFKAVASQDPAATGLDQQNATYVALVVNVFVIIILGTVYKAIARALNDWENHRTDTQYEDNLIAKTFVFCFVNSFATLFYLAFIKSGTVILGQEQLCDQASASVGARDACFGNLGTALLIVFLTQMIVNNTVEILLPTIMGKVNLFLNTSEKKVKETAAAVENAGAETRALANNVGDMTGVNKAMDITGVNKAMHATGAQMGKMAAAMSITGDEEEQKVVATKPGTVVENGQVVTKMRSACEDQFYKKSYEGTFDDFLEIALQFGYVTLFVSAFPLAPFLALVNNQLEIRVDSYKLCKLCRRPVNFGAQDIGTWQYIFYLMGLIAVLTNAGVIFFTSRLILIPPESSTTTPEALRVWAWVISVMGVLLIKAAVDFFIDDVPSDVRIQLQREEYLVRKCLMRERDDEDTAETHGAGEKASAEVKIEIHKVDPDTLAVGRQLAKLILEKYGSMAEAFDFADKNKDGFASTKEMRTFLHTFDGIHATLTDDEIDAIVAALDYNYNGKIELVEFEKLGRI